MEPQKVVCFQYKLIVKNYLSSGKEVNDNRIKKK